MRGSSVLVLIILFFSILLSACQQVEEGDITVNQGGETTNLDRFYAFIENLKHGVHDRIRIANYTTEGDPIFHTIDFNGREILYTYDNSKDKCAGSVTGAKSTTCSDFDNENTEKGTVYYLSGCESDFGYYFEFLVTDLK